jgi:hypothetical protein
MSISPFLQQQRLFAPDTGRYGLKPKYFEAILFPRVAFFIWEKSLVNRKNEIDEK